MYKKHTRLTDARKFFVRGYQVFRHDRANRHKGGLITLVKNSIPAVRVSDSKNEHLEFLMVKLILSDSETMTVVNCYGPPEKDLKLHTIPMTENKFQEISMGVPPAGDTMTETPEENTLRTGCLTTD